VIVRPARRARPGTPVTAHWGLADPAEVMGSLDDQRKAFATTFRELTRRIRLFASLDIEKLDALALKEALARVGRK
jgi:arsenate reductase (thioredoxin)